MRCRAGRHAPHPNAGGALCAGGADQARSAPGAGVRAGQRAAIGLGLPPAHADLGVLRLVAALPSASNVSILAERYGADNGRVARIIISPTALAFF